MWGGADDKFHGNIGSGHISRHDQGKDVEFKGISSELKPRAGSGL